MTLPDLPPFITPHYSWGQIALIVIGIILLLPGLCSLVMILTMTSEIASSDSRIGGFAMIWLSTFAVSALGIWMMVRARRGRSS